MDFEKEKRKDNLMYAGIGEEYEELMNKIEQAIGFQLLHWQKYYIIYGTARISGKTTAYILRQLLDVEAEPLDLSNERETRKNAEDDRNRGIVDNYRSMAKEIYEKLLNSNIPTRTVFFNERDKRSYMSADKQKPEIQKDPRPIIRNWY